ncbi:AMP-binding protein [Arthrobacter sp. I2-34]|uniref:acetate--CoA ligase n=1 Tax=Arthrobacter hankyongi TaxID=2904801 RepID=A0ABS9L3G6_9MICC|nr:AMP-binding protein [Arthrobacter hankyongi]MCG2621203.1 AMP-binding protein [Arthrobacter hankyongi]
MAYIWHPTREYLENSNVARLMATLSVSTADELRARSVADIGAFWDAVVQDLGISFTTPYSQVLDTSRGIEHTEWYVDGRINIVDAALTRWARERPDAVALAHESEDGTVTRMTYGELAGQVARVRGGLRARGIGKGDAVALYMSMTPAAVVAAYAVASLGAMLVPLFSGFAASAIASRALDACAKAIITVDGTVRRGKAHDMLAQVRVARSECPSVEFVVVVDNVGSENLALEAGEVAWNELLAADPDGRVEDTAANDVLLLAYTSGTTGKPKGAVHTHAGFLTKVASEVAYGFDISPGRTFCWVTDMGWIMGPLSVFGTHACGGALLLYEGSPDMPDAGRLWQVAERHRVSMLGVSPTLIRSIKPKDGSKPAGDLSAVRILGSTGEPWDPDSYEWLARDVFDGRVPIINFSGGTEVGGSFLSPYPVEDIASCSLGGPALGMDVDVVDDNARSLRGSIGELVCRQPWPSMTRGIWQDDERYRESYWSTFPGIWRHGDYALADDEGNWFILGRSDDVMNVAGKRVAPAEIESVLSGDPDVSESAVVGIPDPKKGESVWAFWIARGNVGDDEVVAARLRRAVADELGKPFAPTQVVRVDELPKTRSAKILRRAIRAAVLESDAGDLSGAENPGAVDAIRATVRSLR